MCLQLLPFQLKEKVNKLTFRSSTDFNGKNREKKQSLSVLFRGHIKNFYFNNIEGKKKKNSNMNLWKENRIFQ